jgi:hypothetical protein
MDEAADNMGSGSRWSASDSVRRLRPVAARVWLRRKRTRGSHHIFFHPKAMRPLSIQPRGGEAKVYQVVQFLAMVEAFGLTMETEE